MLTAVRSRDGGTPTKKRRGISLPNDIDYAISYTKWSNVAVLQWTTSQLVEQLVARRSSGLLDYNGRATIGVMWSELASSGIRCSTENWYVAVVVMATSGC